jgi:hypothetical protein
MLAEAVTRLDEPLRAVIVLRYFQGLDSSAAGRASGSCRRARCARACSARSRRCARTSIDGTRAGARAGPRCSRPLARGAAVGTGATAVGSTALLVASAGAACVLAAIGVARWSSASDRPERASPVFVAAIPEPTPLPAGAASAGVQQSSREPVTADGREPEDREASELPDPSPAASASAAGDVGELSGTILVDGKPPQWTIELFPELRIPRTTGDVPQQRWKLPEPISVLPEQGGAFTFSGVPLDGHLSLSCPHFDFEDGAKSLELDGPTTGLVLRLKSEPEVVGRIVGPDGQPIAPFTGQCELRVGRTGQPASEAWIQHFETRPDGRFRVVGNPAGEWTALTLLVKEEENGYLLHETPVYANTPHVDLGELRLERVRQVKFALRDPDGKSIPSGFAYVDGPGWDELEQVTHSRAARS